MARLWHYPKRLRFCAMVAFAVATFCIGVVAHWPDLRLDSGKPVNGDSTTGNTGQSPATPAGRDRSQPLPIDVPVAAIGQENASDAGASPLGIADVRPIDPFQAGEAPPAGAGDSQSDAEHLDAQSELSHAVAPVPMQDSAVASAGVRLAALGGLGVNGQDPIAGSPRSEKILTIWLPLPSSTHPVIHLPPLVDLGNQMKVAHGDRRVFIVTAAAANWPAWLDRCWPLSAQIELHWVFWRELLREHEYEQSCAQLIRTMRDIVSRVFPIAGASL